MWHEGVQPRRNAYVGREYGARRVGNRLRKDGCVKRKTCRWTAEGQGTLGGVCVRTLRAAGAKRARCLGNRAPKKQPATKKHRATGTHRPGARGGCSRTEGGAAAVGAAPLRPHYKRSARGAARAGGKTRAHRGADCDANAERCAWNGVNAGRGRAGSRRAPAVKRPRCVRIAAPTAGTPGETGRHRVPQYAHKMNAGWYQAIYIRLASSTLWLGRYILGARSDAPRRRSAGNPFTIFAHNPHMLDQLRKLPDGDFSLTLHGREYTGPVRTRRVAPRVRVAADRSTHST